MNRPSESLERVVLLLDDPNDFQPLVPILSRRDRLGDVNVVYFSSTKFGSRRILQGIESQRDSGRRTWLYDADLPPAQRRAVELLFNRGTSGMTLLATSALELGVDIEGLDMCVMDQLPASRVSLLQRIGRVGRRIGRPGLILLRAGSAPRDRMLVANPVAEFSFDSARAMPLPLHLDAVRLRHALALHLELDVRGVCETDAIGIVGRFFGTSQSADELAHEYQERFDPACDRTDRRWLYGNFRASLTERKVPVVELDGYCDSTPLERRENGERCDVAWLDDALLMREVHPEAVVLGADGQRWRVVDYRERPTGSSTYRRGDDRAASSEIGMVFVVAEPKPVATRGMFSDQSEFLAPSEPSVGATLPEVGALLFGSWDFRRWWTGYREIYLRTDEVRTVSAGDVAARIARGVSGPAGVFFRPWSFRTLGWEWRVSVGPPPAGLGVGQLVASLLAPHLAAAVESTASGMTVVGQFLDGKFVLRVLDHQRGGNGLSEALLHEDRIPSAIANLLLDLGRCRGQDRAFVRLVHRVTDQEPCGSLADVQAVVGALAEAW